MYGMTQATKSINIPGLFHDKRVITLVVGKPGHMLEGLRSLLKAHPRLEVLVTAPDVPSALDVADDCHLGLVLFDSLLQEDDVVAAVHQIKDKSPQTLCIVIADRSQQYFTALASGADSALIKGFTADQLFSVINRLLSNGVGLLGQQG